MNSTNNMKTSDAGNSTDLVSSTATLKRRAVHNPYLKKKIKTPPVSPRSTATLKRRAMHNPYLKKKLKTLPVSPAWGQYAKGFNPTSSSEMEP